jgi:hypothetical protein
MATFSQTTVEPTLSPTGGKGHRHDENIKASFPKSPIHNGPLTHDVVTNQGKKALNGSNTGVDEPEGYSVGLDVNGNITDANTYYHTENPISLNYTRAPSVAEGDTDIDYGAEGGAPVSTYVPALAGEEAFTGAAPTATSQWGSSASVDLLDPSASSLVIGGQTIGNYTKGSSTPLVPAGG